MNRDGHLLALACGDPRKTPSTFTRFVFPFAYHPTIISGTPARENAVGLHFQEIKPCLERKKYFTIETSKVLHESAKWFRINEVSEGSRPENDDKPRCWSDTPWTKGVTLHRGDRKIRTCMLPPQIVLFEWDRSQFENRQRRDGEQSVFSIGFLFLDIYFPRPTESTHSPILDDLLFINDMFRYFDCPYCQHTDQFVSAMREVPLSYSPPYKRVADLSVCDARQSYFDRWARLLAFPLRAGKDGPWYHLIKNPRRAIEGARSFLCGQSTDPDFLVYADNRTYVWSSAVLKKRVDGLQGLARTSTTKSHQFGHWIKLLNVDPPDKYQPTRTHYTTEFERKWAKDRTYHRWEEDGTWYGFTYHSGVQLTSETIPEDGQKKENPYIRHFAGIYFDMAILLFYLRMALFRFSRRLAEITAEKKSFLDRKWAKGFESLREQFSEFGILYQYPLLSNQQQGIEMYSLAREQFDIADFYTEIKSEIENTHEFIELVEAKKLSKKANLIAWIGIPLAASALLTGLLSLNVDDLHVWECFTAKCPFNPEFWILAVISMSPIFLAVLCWAIKKVLKK